VSDPTDPTAPPRRASPAALARDLSTAFLGREAVERGDAIRDRATELAQAEHELALEHIADDADELRAQALHRAIIRSLAEKETRARTRQQEIISVGIGIMVGLGIVVLLLVAMLVGTLVMA